MPEINPPALITAEGDAKEIALMIANLGATGKLRLFQASFAPSYASKEADFLAAEATFVGYASATIATWSAVVFDQSGVPQSIGAGALFVCTGGATPNNIGGFWIEDAGPDVVRYVVFPNPVPISVSGQFIDVVYHLQGSQLGFGDVSY